MSAFLVDYKLIDSILSMRYSSDYSTGRMFHEVGCFGYDALSDLGKEFLDLNIRSLCERYGDDPKSYAGVVENYQFTDLGRGTDIFQAIKSLDCLMYQSCEIENLDEDETFKKMELLRKRLADMVINEDERYKKAEWGLC